MGGPISRKLLDLRDGELSAFLRAFGVLALTIIGHTLLETARDALFLARLPPRLLTYVYVTVAFGAVVITPLSTRLARAVGPRGALVVTLLFTALGAAWFRVRPPTASIVFALYVFGTLSATLLVGQFWTLAGTLFSASQSRRLFGALASGGVLGAVAAAGLAAVIVKQSDLRVLLAFSTIAYFSAALLTTTIEAEPQPQNTPAPNPTLTGNMQKELGRMRREPLVSRLAAITALSAIIAVVIDYLFKARVSASLTRAELGPFFAHYQLFLNAGSLALQLTIVGPLVERMGVVGLALISPTLLVVGGLTSLVSAAAFPVVVALKATDAALRNSLGRVSMELFWAPVENQSRLRGVVDAVVSRGAQAGAGAALLGLSMRGTISNLALAGIATAFAVGWLGVGLGSRAPYIELFRNALGRGNLDRERTLAELDVNAVETIVEALARPETGDVIAAMNLLAERERTRLIPALILYHDDPEVLIRALELFGSSPRKDWYPLGERLFNHASARVQNAAVRAFALSGAEEELGRAAQHTNPSVRGFAALYLAQRAGRSMQGDPLTWPLFADDDATTHALKRAFIEALAANPTVDAPKLLLAFAKAPALAGAATRAMMRVADANCIPFLIERLAVADDRLSARRALVQLGDPAFSALLEALTAPQIARRVRIHVPRTLAAFEHARAVQELLVILRSNEDGLIRYKALRGLEQLARTTSLRIAIEPILQELAKNSLEYLRLFVLLRTLRSEGSGRAGIELVVVEELIDDKLHQSRDRLVRLVQVAHRSEDIRSVFAALDAQDRRQRGRAVEFLDALVRSLSRNSDETASLLRLVVDELTPEERARRAAPLIGEIPSLRAALQRLTEDTDSVLRELASSAIRGVVDNPPPEPGAIGELAFGEA